LVSGQFLESSKDHGWGFVVKEHVPLWQILVCYESILAGRVKGSFLFRSHLRGEVLIGLQRECLRTGPKRASDFGSPQLRPTTCYWLVRVTASHQQVHDHGRLPVCQRKLTQSLLLADNRQISRSYLPHYGQRADMGSDGIAREAEETLTFSYQR
jgi:hypothetical protein